MPNTDLSLSGNSPLNSLGDPCTLFLGLFCITQFSFVIAVCVFKIGSHTAKEISNWLCNQRDLELLTLPGCASHEFRLQVCNSVRVQPNTLFPQQLVSWCTWICQLVSMCSVGTQLLRKLGKKTSEVISLPWCSC